MIRHALTLALLVGLAAFLEGCASGPIPRDAHLSASPLAIDSSLTMRPALRPRPGVADVPIVVCVEPSLDVTLMLADSILARAQSSRGNGRVEGTRDGSLIELAERTRAEAASLRNTLGQLCGAWSRHGQGVAGRPTP